MLQLPLILSLGLINNSIKTHSRSEDCFAPLSGLHCSCSETSSIAHTLDMVDNWYVRVTCKDEVAVHAVWVEVLIDGELGCGEGLCDDRATVDASSTRGMP